MRTLGNVLWFILGGFISGTVYMLLGALFCLTIIGIPIGKAMFEYGKLMYFPFGKVIVRETFLKGKENISAVRRVGGVIANIIWFPFGLVTFIASIGHMILCFVSIIFIPVAIVIAKSCVFLLAPIGAKVITKEEYQARVTANFINATQADGGGTSHGQADYTAPPPPPPNDVAPAPVQIAGDAAQGRYCVHCGGAMSMDASFCRSCGRGVEENPVEEAPAGPAPCPCGYENREEAKFCAGCGNPI